MNGDERDDALLFEAALSAWRGSDREGRVHWSPAWADLDPDARREAFAATAQLRQMEAALDSRGLSATAREVLRRLDEV